MAIPQSQLETWAHQGSIAQSSDTYGTIKRALEAKEAKYAGRDFEVLLQGSYGNDTNIYAESDVDIVIRYDGAFYHDLSSLSPLQQAAFQSTYSNGTYPYNQFKEEVQQALERTFGTAVKPGTKAIKIEASGSRRNTDVVVAFQYRRYHRFIGISNQNFDKGIAFFTKDNTRIANYPKHHSENCTAKHQRVGKNFKPLIRIFKNIRSKLVDDGIIEKTTAPSYYIEGLLYNIPDTCFSGSYNDMVFSALKWLHQTPDRSKFVCANNQYYLMRDSNPVCWPIASGEHFIKAAINLWDKW